MGELQVVRLDKEELGEREDLMKLVYFKGQLYNKTNLQAARLRCTI